VAALGLWAVPGFGQTQTFVDDFAGWSAATGVFSTIDFETLPDGSPSVAGTDINALLNYTNQGATFSSPLDDLIIVGNPIGGFGLRVRDDGTIQMPTSIRADLVTSARSVGFSFGGSATFEAFDEGGSLLASEFFSGSGSGFFLGVTSDVPIEYVVMDNTIGTAHIQSFHFTPVPEPVTVALELVGFVQAERATRREWRWSRK
jgi:hypothetical protein